MAIAATLSAALLIPTSAQEKSTQSRGATPPQGELKATRDRLERLKKELAASEESRVEASDELRDTERAISEANRALRDVANRQAKTRAELNELNRQMRRTEAEIAGRQRDIERVLVLRYMHGAPGVGEILFNDNSPEQVARNLHYFGYVSRAHAGVIQALRANVEALTGLAAQARSKVTELAALEAEQRKERQTLAGQQDERKRLLARLTGQIRTQRQEIDTLQRNERRLAQLVERLAKMLQERAVQRPRPPVSRNDAKRNDKVPEDADSGGVFSDSPGLPGPSGRLRLPVRGELVGRFGAPRGSGTTWKGLFIRAAEGAEVQALAAGRVVFADWMRGFGNLLILDHGRGYLTIYGNNESLLKQPGENVAAGESVATVGHSGGNEESGLYFEVRHQGKSIDPMPWIAAK